MTLLQIVSEVKLRWRFFLFIFFQGALSGCLLSLVLCGWLLIGAENALASGALTFQGKPLAASGCGKGNITHPYTNFSTTLSNVA